jgi:hypothetical protein
MKKSFLQLFYIVVTSLALWMGVSVKSYAQYKTDSLQIMLLTATPGTEIYSLYGHSALRVYDEAKGNDIIYNYGIFDFETPNFYLKFINGNLLYQLGKSSFNRFVSSYEQSGQGIYQQRLNLTNKEKWQLVGNLEINYLPENRFYRYSFFHDNCATRIRDLIAKSIDGTIIYDNAYIKKSESFRDLIKIYQHGYPWVDFGTHILIGSDADSICKITDYMFLPIPMMNIYVHSKILSKGIARPLIDSPINILPGTLITQTPNPITLPLTVIGGLFMMVLLVSILGYRKNKHYKFIDQIVLLLTGIIGVTILLVWVGSAHQVLSRNYNIVWANPISLVFVFFLFFKTPPKWFPKASIVYGSLLALFILVSLFIRQSIPASAYPIMGILIVRLVKFGLLQIRKEVV